MEWRKAFFDTHIAKNGLGIEIGPSHKPIAAKKDGYNVKIVDHANKDELVKKYKALEIDTSQIEEVDYVWDGKKTLTELIGKPHKFDYIIASHVVEHTTDLIHFIKDAENLLKPSGKLLLAIPDKRYCFDYFRFPTTTGDLLDAYHTKRVRHTSGKIFDYFSSAARRGGKDMAWSESDTRELNLVHNSKEVREKLREAEVTSAYVDIHNWMFTPASFRLIMSDLQSLAITKLSYVDQLPTRGFEFFVVLSRKAPSIKETRIKLLQNVADDMSSALLAGYANMRLESVTTELESIRNSKRWRYSTALANMMSSLRNPW